MATLRKIPQLNRGGGPGRDRGRVQRAARRAAIGRDVLSTADVVALAFVRKRLLYGRRLEPHDYRLARRALELIADPIGRSPKGPGKPMLWRLRERDMDAT